MKCRHCGEGEFIPFADLDYCPPSNSMLKAEEFGQPEVYYPLKVETCANCFLSQVDEHKAAVEIFSDDYTYFSSFSKSWLAHAERFAEMATERFGLGGNSLVLEVASNDGYLLQYFKAKGIPVMGVEPTANTAEVAAEKGIPSIVEFFGADLARREFAEKQRLADLICGNNVYAHVPDINDFTAGLKAALAPSGVISLEFPHLLQLLRENQFDTIYHEHFSYLSLAVVQRIFASQGLTVFDVERLPTHGGSLRVFGRHAENGALPITERVDALLTEERAEGLEESGIYREFQAKIDSIRAEFLGFLLAQRQAGKTVAAYGAAAKGNTLLNYCGVKGTDMLSFVCDLSPHKQGRLLPGSHIPVLDPKALDEHRPDYIVILPWNLKSEIVQQLSHVREWGARFVVAIPSLQIL